jgi:hypothetical protein
MVFFHLNSARAGISGCRPPNRPNPRQKQIARGDVSPRAIDPTTRRRRFQLRRHRKKQKPDRNSLADNPANKDSVVEPKRIVDGSSRRNAGGPADGDAHRGSNATGRSGGGHTADHGADHGPGPDDCTCEDSSEKAATGYEFELAGVQFSNLLSHIPISTCSLPSQRR